ncbi:hypothetical protein ADK46_21720 [Streptomyces rimosus subsp. rimosus]|nr:hypothetical protein ADK46_21720 [Streptomyces rimosus subsp. rimosus]
MAVRIARTTADQGDARRQTAYQPRILVPGTVVGDLEHIHGGQLRMRGRQSLLGHRFEVAQQEERQARGAQQQRDTGVVRALDRAEGGAGEGGIAGVGDGRPQNLPAQRPRAAPLPGRGSDHRHSGGRCRMAYEGGLAGWFGQGRGLDGADRAPAQGAGQPADVIGMEMRENDERDAAYSQVGQAVIDGGRLRAGVHDQGGPLPCAEDQAVALPHVTGHGAPPRRRPADEDAGERRRAQHRDQQGQYAEDAQPGSAQQPAPHQYACDRDGHEQQRTAPAARPAQLRAGQRRSRTGDTGDPLGRPAGTPGQRLSQGRNQRSGGERRETQHGGRGDGQFGQQVAGHGDEADAGGEHHDDGRTDRLRRGCRGDQLGEARRHPATLQGGAPARGEEEQRAGGQYREQEAVTPGEPGVVEHQHQNRGGEGGDEGTAASRTDREQRDQATGGGPQHAGVGSADDHEGERDRAADEGGRAQREAQERRQATAFGPYGEVGRADEQDEQDGQIASGDGEQMGQVGGAKGIVEVGRDARGVADHQAREQRAGVGAQIVGGRAEAGP